MTNLDPTDTTAATIPYLSGDPQLVTSPTYSTPVDIATSRTLSDEQLIALNEVIKAVARERSPQAALRLVAEKARQMTRSASAALCRLDSTRTMLDFAAVAGPGATDIVGQRVRVADALPGQTAVSGEQLLAYNPPTVSSSARDVPADDSYVLTAVIRSAAIVPIYVGGVSIGSLGAINKQDGLSFTGSDLLMIHILAGLAAVTIQQETHRRHGAQMQRERDILFEAARTTSSTLNVQDILDGMLATLTTSLDISAAMVFLLNDERSHLFIAAERGLTDDEREIQLLADGRVASSALAGSTGPTAFVVRDIDNDPRFEAILPDDKARPQSWMIAPLVSREKQLGIVVAGSLQRDAYTEEDLRLLAAVAAPTAVALENAELYEEATRRTEEATAIYELSQAVNTYLNLPRVLNFVADSVLSLLHVDKFALFLHNRETNCLEIKVARNLRRQTVAEMRPDHAAGGIAWWVYEYETPTAVQNVAADHRNRTLPIDQEDVASLVSVPLQAGEDVIGVIHAMSSRRRSFTVGEMELLYTIANQVGVAISNIQILEEAKHKSAELRRASRRVARALGSTLDPTQTAQTIVGLASDIIRGDKTLLYSRDPRDGELILRAAAGTSRMLTPQVVEAHSDDGRELTCQWVARRSRSLAVENSARDVRINIAPGIAAQIGRYTGYLAMPLKIGSGVVGVLEIFTRESRSFPADVIRQYAAFTAQAAVAMQNAMLVEQASRRRQDLETLGRLAQRALGPAEGLIDDALEILRSTLDAVSGIALTSDSPHEHVAGRNCPLFSEDCLESLRVALGSCVARGEDLMWPDLALEPLNRPDWTISARNLSFVGIVDSGAAIGFARKLPARFDGNDYQLVQTASRILQQRLR